MVGYDSQYIQSSNSQWLCIKRGRILMGVSENVTRWEKGTRKRVKGKKKKRTNRLPLQRTSVAASVFRSLLTSPSFANSY